MRMASRVAGWVGVIVGGFALLGTGGCAAPAQPEGSGSTGLLRDDFMRDAPPAPSPTDGASGGGTGFITGG